MQISTISTFRRWTEMNFVAQPWVEISNPDMLGHFLWKGFPLSKATKSWGVLQIPSTKRAPGSLTAKAWKNDDWKTLRQWGPYFFRGRCMLNFQNFFQWKNTVEKTKNPILPRWPGGLQRSQWFLDDADHDASQCSIYGVRLVLKFPGLQRLASLRRIYGFCWGGKLFRFPGAAKGHHLGI